MPQDSPTRFKGKPGVGKRVAWAEPLPLAEVKAIGQRARRVGQRRAAVVRRRRAARLPRATRATPTDGVMIRALVPVNLRPLEKAYKLGNQFGLVFLDLPIGIENPVERLYAVRANMNALKGSLPAGAGARACSRRWARARRCCRSSCCRRSRATRTRGDDQRARARSSRSTSPARAIERLMFWVPQSGDIGMGVSILSYDGARAVRPHHRPRAVSRSRARHRALRRGVREARADDADGAVAARRRSRSGARQRAARRAEALSAVI